MTNDATFWVAISFLIFISVLIYLKIPQKINVQLNNIINNIKNELNEAEKLKDETKNLLNESQEKLENSKNESKKIISVAKEESEKMIIEINKKFFQNSENKKKLTEQKIQQMKEKAIKDIKDTSVKITIESVSNLIGTSIEKTKLDNFFNKNLKNAKDTLKNNII